MAKKTKFRFPWLLLFMVLYAAAALVGIKYGLEWFWGYMEDFEASQPEHAITRYMEQLSNDAFYKGAAEQITQLDSNLITEEECRTMIDNAVSGGITYAKNNKESSSERHVYMLLSGKQTIGKVVTQPGEPDENGFRIWSATEESFDFSFLMGTGTSITVPHNFTVSANGTALDESYIVESNIPYKTLEDYYGTYEGLPYMVTYKTPAIWGKQALLVTDAEGKIVTIDETTDMESFVYTCTQEEVEAVESLAEDFLKQYIVFISCSNAARKQEYKTLIGFIVDGAPLEDRMYDAMDGLQWVTKQKNKLLSIQFNSCMPLGEDRYLCDLTYTSETSKYEESSTDVTNTKIILVKSGKKLLIESMQNY